MTMMDMSLVDRMRWAVVDAVTMTRRYLLHVVRSPAEVVLYFALPIMFVLVFGYVFGSGMSVPGGGSYREFLLPGVFAMTMLYGLGATATAVATDVGRGGGPVPVDVGGPVGAGRRAQRGRPGAGAAGAGHAGRVRSAGGVAVA